MNNSKKHIVVFEHESIRFDKGTERISEEQFNALGKYYGENGVPYFDLCYNGVRFNEHVGVIQIGNTLIEVLPKADKKLHTSEQEKKWRNILIDMLRSVDGFEIKAPSQSDLKIKPNTILDLYFEMFIKEVEYLLHSGLIKKYRKKEGNISALKGTLQFAQHLQKNLTHQERFYVDFTTYDTEHKLHFILYKTIRLLKQINTSAVLQSRLGALLLIFPEMPDIKVSSSTFDRLEFNRKTQSYKKGIEIARLILLHYHPDVSKGRNYVLALMFDMNNLWEQFIYVTLRKNNKSGISVTAQTSKYFWKPEKGYRSKIRPDILVKKDNKNFAVLDTKWKNLNGSNPSPDDLRQMYVYHEYYGAKRVALIYPGADSSKTSGTYLDPFSSEELDKECSIINFSIEDNIKQWQVKISKQFEDWLKLP